MRKTRAILASILLSAVLCGCSSPVVSIGKSDGTGSGSGATRQTALPLITKVNAQNGAIVVSIKSPTPGATIAYTLDGATPNPNASATVLYEAPFLVASKLTVKAIAKAPGYAASAVASEAFSPDIAHDTLVWSDEFTNSTRADAEPNPLTWTYDTGPGADCCGNNELENYCAWGSTTPPCNPTHPNVYEDTAGILHIVAREPSRGVYTSARLKTQGRFSFHYGRIEARMKLPESQGMWPAFWLLGNNITTISWPACGELDVMEHIDGSDPQNEGFDWVQGSIHGAGLNGGVQYHPAGFSAAAWHTYGMIWSKGRIQYYVDSPSNIYATFTPETQTGVWPFDAGPQFILLNLAVGGDWPGSPNAQTPFPSEIQVDYVRLYTN
jgi:beta-glucanase (GH16 family)